jgi:hypothetical protein
MNSFSLHLSFWYRAISTSSIIGFAWLRCCIWWLLRQIISVCSLLLLLHKILLPFPFFTKTCLSLSFIPFILHFLNVSLKCSFTLLHTCIVPDLF